MTLLTTILNFLETKFAYVFSAVTAAINAVLSEIPDDEIAILHGAMTAAGGSAEEALTAALNFTQTQEIAELSKVAMAFLNAFIAATAPAA